MSQRRKHRIGRVGEERSMFKLLLAALAAALIILAPPVLAGHGGGELLRSPERVPAPR